MATTDFFFTVSDIPTLNLSNNTNVLLVLLIIYYVVPIDFSVQNVVMKIIFIKKYIIVGI